MLRRIYGIESLRCSTCGGPLRILAAITDPEVIHRILAHLGLPTDLPTPARARDPPQTCLDFPAD